VGEDGGQVRGVVRFDQGQVLANYLRVGLAAHPDPFGWRLSEDSLDSAVKNRGPNRARPYQGAVDVEQEQAFGGHEPTIE
jgi:hypothetical protein